MHGGGCTGACTGQVCSASVAKIYFPSSRCSPRGGLGLYLRMGPPAPLPTSQGCVCPCPCPSHPSRQESVASRVCCRERGKPSPRFGAGLDVAMMPSAGLCRTHAGPACLPSPGCLGLRAPGSAGRDVWAAPAHLCVRKEKIQTGDFLWGAEHRSISLCAVKPKGHLENFFCQGRS